VTFDKLLRENSEPKRLISALIETVDFTNQEYTYNLFLNTTTANGFHVGLTQLDSAVLKTAT
jgi:hypothetical protein